MKGVVVVAALIFLFMLAIKDGYLFHHPGLNGGCTAVAAPAGQDGAWQKCTAGKLQGLPNLTRQGCTAVTRAGNTEFWRCPAQIGSAPGT
jgi:hypothetical protein